MALRLGRRRLLRRRSAGEARPPGETARFWSFGDSTRRLGFWPRIWLSSKISRITRFRLVGSVVVRGPITHSSYTRSGPAATGLLRGGENDVHHCRACPGTSRAAQHDRVGPGAVRKRLRRYGGGGPACLHCRITGKSSLLGCLGTARSHTAARGRRVHLVRGNHRTRFWSPRTPRVGPRGP